MSDIKKLGDTETISKYQNNKDLKVTEKYCPKHTTTRIWEYKGEVIQCEKCDGEEQIRKHVKEVAASRVRRYIPEIYIDMDLNAYKLYSENQKGLIKYLNNYIGTPLLDKKNLVFVGNQGTGKTLMSMIILKEVIRKGYNINFIRCKQFFEEIQCLRESDYGYMSLIRESKHTDFLVIDEIGRHKGSDYEKDILFDIINDRIEQRKKMILISNLRLTQSLNGEKVFTDFIDGSRISDKRYWDILFFNWQDYRQWNSKRS